MPPPRLSRLPPEPAASTFPRQRSRARGCTVRRGDEEEEEEARNAAAAAAAGRSAPAGHWPRGCSQALRGALGRGHRRLSSPSPEPGPGLTAAQLSNFHHGCSFREERTERSRVPAPGHVSCRSAQRVPPHHRRQPARPLRRRAGNPGASTARGEAGAGRGRARGGRGRAGGGRRAGPGRGSGRSRAERGRPPAGPHRARPGGRPRGWLGLAARRPPVAAPASAVLSTV